MELKEFELPQQEGYEFVTSALQQNIPTEEISPSEIENASQKSNSLASSTDETSDEIKGELQLLLADQHRIICTQARKLELMAGEFPKDEINKNDLSDHTKKLYEKAVECYDYVGNYTKVEELNLKFMDFDKLADIYWKRAKKHDLEKKLSKALTYYKLGLKHCIHQDEWYYVKGIAKIYVKQQEHGKALDYYKYLIDVAKLKYGEEVIVCYMHLVVDSDQNLKHVFQEIFDKYKHSMREKYHDTIQICIKIFIKSSFASRKNIIAKISSWDGHVDPNWDEYFNIVDENNSDDEEEMTK